MKKIFFVLAHIFALLRFKVLQFLENVAEPAVKLTNILKEFVNNPAVDIAVELTRTQIDDRILEALKKALPKISAYLKIISEIEPCLETTDTVGSIQCLGKIIDKINPELRPDIYKRITREIALYLLPENVTLSNSKANLLVEIAYAKVKHADLQIPEDIAQAAAAENENESLV